MLQNVDAKFFHKRIGKNQYKFKYLDSNQNTLLTLEYVCSILKLCVSIIVGYQTSYGISIVAQ